MSHETPTLYGDEASPPVRLVQMTAEVLGIKINFKNVDLFSGEHKTDWYAKINPIQKVPAFDTGKGFVICESHPIAMYLCRQVPNNDLYPADTLLRAKVEELMFFNAGSLFPLDAMMLSAYFAGQPLDQSNVEKWYKYLDFLEIQLQNNQWLAGDKMTLADLACAPTICSVRIILPLTDRHPKVAEWMKRLDDVPCFEINKRGVKRLTGFAEKMKKK